MSKPVAALVVFALGTVGARHETPAAPSSPFARSAPTSRAADGVAIIRRMHDRYAATWYRSLSFTERAELRGADGKLTTATWWEEGTLPGRLRIDVGFPASDTVHARRIILYANDSLYLKDPGQPIKRSKSLNLLLILGFDIYRQPVERTVAELTGEGFDLSRVHEGTWHGRPVDVVGAAAGDTTSKQFWVDRERDVFVRMLEPIATAGGGTSDAWFDQYRPLAGGWIATEVGVEDHGIMRLHEIYSDIKANVTLPDAWFDPAKLR